MREGYILADIPSNEDTTICRKPQNFTQRTIETVLKKLPKIRQACD